MQCENGSASPPPTTKEVRMFGSQVLETAIGLAVMFFVIAFAASSIVEVYSRLLSKRAKDLESTVAAMLAGTDVPDDDVAKALKAFTGTSIYASLQAAAGKTFIKKRPKLPSYVSAKAFADAVTEMIGSDGAIDDLPAGLRKRLEPLVREARSDLLMIKAGLERWFDETMGRLEGAYKRWATTCLFFVGLIVAVGGNASTFDVAEKLWHDPVTREAVTASAGRLTEQTSPGGITKVADATDKLKELGLPVGWDEASKTEWKDWYLPWEWSWWPADWSSSQLGTSFGWLLTGLFVMLGAPFWFDVLTKLASLRSAGTKPPAATRDQSSNTSLALETGAAGDLAGPAVGGGTFEANLKAALGVQSSPGQTVPQGSSETAPEPVPTTVQAPQQRRRWWPFGGR
jgi:hypothetical protein